MSVKFNFEGKVVLVTGSSSGIGAATAILFARSGARVVVTGRNAERVSEVAKECQKVSPNGQKVLEVVADVTKEYDTKKLVETSIKEFGKIDVLVNNAGFGVHTPFNDPNYVLKVKNTFDGNLNSVLHLTQLCVPYLEKSNGNVVNISSVASFKASGAGGSAYCMSKTSLDMFTKCMAVELGPKNIRVNSICPGGVRTPIRERAGQSKAEADAVWNGYALKYPVGRCGEPDDIAFAILFLSSDASSFITGTNLLVDGGHIAANV